MLDLLGLKLNSALCRLHMVCGSSPNVEAHVERSCWYFAHSVAVRLATECMRARRSGGVACIAPLVAKSSRKRATLRTPTKYPPTQRLVIRLAMRLGTPLVRMPKACASWPTVREPARSSTCAALGKPKLCCARQWQRLPGRKLSIALAWTGISAQLMS